MGVIGSRELAYQVMIMPTRGKIKGKCITSFMLVLHPASRVVSSETTNPLGQGLWPRSANTQRYQIPAGISLSVRGLNTFAINPST